jgi:hypothetical protein
MADLSSCYFCGAAMDVSLRESTVVPDALAPTPAHQTTVVLCGTCERKLERVLDPVVAAANASATATGGAAAAGDDTTADDGTDGDATASGDADATVPPSILSDVADDASTTSDDDATAEGIAGNDTAADAAGSESTGEDGTPFEVDDTTSVFDDADDAASSSVFADANDTPTTPIQDAESDDDADGIAFDDQSRDDTAADRESTTNAASASNTSTDGASTDDTTTTANGSDAPDVDPRTYNKVVRLLKNRDLPVPRDEIESIAGSAYDIPDHECEAILDAAIQRGLVAEADGQLTHPDGI